MLIGLQRDSLAGAGTLRGLGDGTSCRCLAGIQTRFRNRPYEADLTKNGDQDDVHAERPPLGIGFAILLAVLLSLPLWGAIIWFTQMAWCSLVE